MPMPPYTVRCQGCGSPAAFKIAARWSDGHTEELKTYALCCPGCVAALYPQAAAKQAACRLAPGEILDSPGVYELPPAGGPLTRRPDLEHQ
jgi:hypothetical protein